MPKPHTRRNLRDQSDRPGPRRLWLGSHRQGRKRGQDRSPCPPRCLKLPGRRFPHPRPLHSSRPLSKRNTQGHGARSAHPSLFRPSFPTRIGDHPQGDEQNRIDSEIPGSRRHDQSLLTGIHDPLHLPRRLSGRNGRGFQGAAGFPVRSEAGLDGRLHLLPRGRNPGIFDERSRR